MFWELVVCQTRLASITAEDLSFSPINPRRAEYLPFGIARIGYVISGEREMIPFYVSLPEWIEVKYCETFKYRWFIFLSQWHNSFIDINFWDYTLLYLPRYMVSLIVRYRITTSKCILCFRWYTTWYIYIYIKWSPYLYYKHIHKLNITAHIGIIKTMLTCIHRRPSVNFCLCLSPWQS